MQTETQQSVQVRLSPTYAGTDERRSEIVNTPLNVSSPSQGPCCTPECAYKSRNEKCREESECAHQGMCNGATAQCPTSEPKANFTACHGDTQVCLNGVSERLTDARVTLAACLSSPACVSGVLGIHLWEVRPGGVHLRQCGRQRRDGTLSRLLHGEKYERLYSFCWMFFYLSVEMMFVSAVNPSTCSSTGSERLARFFNKKVTTLQAGSPCNDFKGYCDVFMKCRLVDADGPLARLKKAIFNPELYENIAEWIVVSVWMNVFDNAALHVCLICVCVFCLGSLVGSFTHGHRSHHAYGGIYQNLQRSHTEQQPQTTTSKTPAR